MKTITQNQSNPLINVTEENSELLKAPTHALITNVILKNGNNAPIITMFNCADFSFEEIKIGVDTAINRHDKIQLDAVSKQSTLYRVNNGNLKSVAIYPKTNINTN